VTLKPKKPENEKIKKVKAVKEQGKTQPEWHDIEPNPSMERVMHERDNILF
jgi:hypothetical protein